MNTSVSEEIKLPSILKLKFDEDSMHVDLSDGRTITIPLAWYPKLLSASKEQLENFEISPAGYGLHWPDLDEDLSVYGFLFPNPAAVTEHIKEHPQKFPGKERKARKRRT